MKCPQGCVHPIHGEDCVRQRRQRIKLDHPRFKKGPYGRDVYKQTHETRTWMECRVCGATVGDHQIRPGGNDVELIEQEG